MTGMPLGEERSALPLFPLEQVVLFPGMPLPLRVFEDRYKLMIGTCQVTDGLFGVLLIRSGTEVGAPAEPERVGCTARLVRVDRLPNGWLHVMSVGERRFRLRAQPRLAAEGYLVADVRFAPEIPPDGQALRPLLAEVLAEFTAYRAAARQAGDPRAREDAPAPPADPVRLSYVVASGLRVHPREQQALLALDDVAVRLRRELAILRRENRPAPASIGPFSVN